MTRIVPFLMAAILLAACVPNDQSSASAPPVGVVSFAPVKQDRAGFCIVGFSVTYPEATAPHKRRITVTEPALGTSNSYDLPIPALGPPTAFVRQNGMITYTGLGNASQWVINTLRLVRPGLTLLSMAMVAALWSYDALSLTQADSLIEAVIFIATTSVAWWFGDRAPGRRGS